MAKYLKEFQNYDGYTAYTADTANFIKPNVSYCVQENEVHMSPYVVDPYNGHDYVEIGGLKWATMNVGATAVTDGGLYFQWGDTVGYTAEQVGMQEGDKRFDTDDYKFHVDRHMTKYNSTDGKTTLDLEDDAARVNMGGQWRMPTSAEFVALGSAVNTAWTNDYQGSGVSGLVCTDKNDNTKILFFPANGYCTYGSVFEGDVQISSSSLSENEENQYGMICWSHNDDTYWQKDGLRRWSGFPVRGVVG